MKKQYKMLLYAAIVVFLAGLAWAGMYFSKTPAFNQVEILEVKKGAIETELSEDITIAPAVASDLSFENTGKIKGIYVSVGDMVKKGQLLAEQENSEYLAGLSRAEALRDAADAQLGQAEEDVEVQKAKVRSLKKSDTANKYDVKAQEKTRDKSEAGVDAQESLLEAAESAVESAKLELAKTRLYAPMEGVITEKDAEAGEVKAQATPILSISSEDALEADAYLTETDMKKVKVGDSAEVTLVSTDGNGQTLQAKISNIYPAPAVQNGGPAAYKVVFDLIDSGSNLKVGLTGTAKIKLSRELNAVFVPQSSLFSDGGKDYVMVISGGLPEKKEVEEGARGSDGNVEILSGLSEGDKVIKF